MTSIAGADIVIRSDIGLAPFVLDLDYLDMGGEDSVLTPIEDTLAPLECEVTNARWRWGADEWMGPLTVVEGGEATIILADPDRTYDPANPAVVRPVVPGAQLAIDVDGIRAWTGIVRNVSHSYAFGTTTLECEDAVAILNRVTFPGWAPKGDTRTILNYILNYVGWPANLRAWYGTPTALRGAGTEPVQAWTALQRDAAAELGLLWVDRLGRVAMRARGDLPTPSANPPRVGCDGADVDELLASIDRESIRNHVLVELDDTHPTVEWTDAPSVSIYGRRTTRGKRDELRLVVS